VAEYCKDSQRGEDSGGDKTQMSEGKILLKTTAVSKGAVESIQVYRQNMLQP
jgi:hypothetical protein